MPQVAAAVAALDAAHVAAVLADGGEIGISIDGADHTLGAEDVTLALQPLEGYEVEAEAGHAVALQLELDEELRREGLAREIVHAVQIARKDAGLEITDRIELGLGGDEELLAAAREHEAYLAGEVLATAVAYDGAGDGAEARSTAASSRSRCGGREIERPRRDLATAPGVLRTSTPSRNAAARPGRGPRSPCPGALALARRPPARRTRRASLGRPHGAAVEPPAGPETAAAALPRRLLPLRRPVFEADHREPRDRRRVRHRTSSTYPLGNVPAAVAGGAGRSDRLREKFGVANVFAYGSSAGGTLAALLAGDGLVAAAVAKAPVSDLVTWEWPLTTYGPELLRKSRARRRPTATGSRPLRRRPRARC